MAEPHISILPTVLVVLSAKTESSRMQTEGCASQLSRQSPPDGTTFRQQHVLLRKVMILECSHLPAFPELTAEQTPQLAPELAAKPCQVSAQTSKPS